jgi:hypothetical protein
MLATSWHDGRGKESHGERLTGVLEAMHCNIPEVHETYEKV